MHHIQSTNLILLKDVMQSHPLHRTCFGPAGVKFLNSPSNPVMVIRTARRTTVTTGLLKVAEFSQCSGLVPALRE